MSPSMLFSFFCTFSMSVRILRCSASNCSISFSIPQSYSFPPLPNGTFPHIIKRPCKAYFHSLHNFFQTFSPFSLHVSIFIPTFAIATINMRSTPHEQRARRYVQAQPTFSKRCGLIFLPITCRIGTRGASPLFMRSTPHYVEMPETEYGGSPSTCFLALCGG